MSLSHQVGSAQALVGERRRKPDVDNRHVRVRGIRGTEEAIDVAFGRDHFHSSLCEQPREAFAQQYVVVHDRYSHGRNAIKRLWF